MCKYVIDETKFSPDEIVCLVVHLVSEKNNVETLIVIGRRKEIRKKARAAAYHGTPIRLCCEDHNINIEI